MIYLHNKDTGSVFPVLEQSVEHEFLRAALSTTDSKPLYEEIGYQELTGLEALAPLGEVAIVKYVGAVTTAADDINVGLGLCPCDGTVASIAVVPSADVVGAASNYRTLSLVDDGPAAQSAGGSYAQVAATTVGSKAFSASNVTLDNGAENAVTVSSATVLANDILRFKSAHTGSGMVFPDLVAIIKITRKA